MCDPCCSKLVGGSCQEQFWLLLGAGFILEFLLFLS